MLIGEVMERTPKVSAAENMANRLADRVRNLWLTCTGSGRSPWEENFSEDPDGVVHLAEESFPGLKGIDYIFRWWGGEDLDDLAGDLEVLWKTDASGSMEIYKTTIRFANRDFVMGNRSTETKKREAFRADFRSAFAKWEKAYRAMR